MEPAEEDTYSTIFNALKHPIRRRILRIINSRPSTYTEIQNQLNIDNGLLNYHLDNMRSLLTKEENGSYNLSDFGRGATVLLERVEQPIASRGGVLFGLSHLQVKSVIVILIVCVGAVAFLYTRLDARYYVLEESHNALSLSLAEEQKRLESDIVFETLQIVLVEEEIPDHNLLTRYKSPISLNWNISVVVLSTELIEDVEVPNWVGRYKILLLSPDEIKAKSEAEGAFMYLTFTRFDPNPDNIMVTINTAGIFDAGGGMTIQFRLTGKIYQWWIA